MSYIMRRKTDKGYRFFIVTPKTVDGKLKRGHDLCIGDEEEAEVYLKARRRTPEGADLYRKFCVSVERARATEPKRRKKRKSRANALVD